MTDFIEIQKLAELFNPKKKDLSDTEEEEDVIDGTTDICTSIDSDKAGTSKQTIIKKTPYAKLKTNQESENNQTSKEIEDPDDEKFFFQGEDSSSSDWRKCPQWDVAYRQQVTPSDVFLQMGGKSPATASCEDMVLSVHLPGESRQNIDLKVTAQRVELVSPNFRLDLPLPHPVNPQLGNAQWSKDEEKLIITLKMNREFDYINF